MNHIENYYLLYNTKNCYSTVFIQDNNDYYFSSDDNKFHKCYSSCSKCNIGRTDIILKIIQKVVMLYHMLIMDFIWIILL